MMNLAIAERETTTGFETEELFRSFLVQKLEEDGYNAEIIDVEKPTGVSYRGVRISIDEKLAASINTHALYEEVSKGNICFAEAYDRFLELYENSKKTAVLPEFDLRNYASVREHLMPVLVAKESLQGMNDYPSTDFCDLAVLYKVWVSKEGSTTITKELMDTLGVSVETLHADAIANLSRKKIHIVGLQEFFGLPDETSGPKVVSIESEKAISIFGASIILHPDFEKRIREAIGEEEFYILPSSKHEVIIMPARYVSDPMDMVNMVKEVNATEVEEEDRLTDNAYFYNKDGEIRAVIS